MTAEHLHCSLLPQSQRVCASVCVCLCVLQACVKSSQT